LLYMEIRLVPQLSTAQEHVSPVATYVVA
jgi:hypothetical protein